MKKTIAIVLALIMLFAVTGCGATAKADAAFSTTAAEVPMAAPKESMMVEEAGWGMAYDNGVVEYPAAEAEAAVAGVSSGTAQNPAGNANVKLIYRADMYVQTTDFQQTYQAVVNLVNESGGYFESSSVSNGGYYSDGTYMSGYYTVRIPAENYGSFINAVGSSCHVTNLNESVEDVGLEYFEVESRLETLRIKQDRLQELLAQAENMTDIIDLENALSDCEYQIDMYKSNLNRYDSLIGYSTVSINIEKVNVFTPAVQEELTLGQRVERAFDAGVKDFKRGFENFVVWGSRNILDILLVLVIILVIFAIRPFRRLRARDRRWDERHEARRTGRAEKRAERAAKKAAKKAGKGRGAYNAPTDTESEGDDWSQPAYVETDQDGNEKK